MHCQPSVKICTAEQAKNIHQYKNNKLKLHKTNAAIWYNKSCRMKGLTLKYISIKVSGNNMRSKYTTSNAIRYRINQEIKFLYAKKQTLNEQLYRRLLVCAAQWPNTWQIILTTIDSNLQLQMDKHYNHLNKKLDHLLQRNPCKPATRKQEEEKTPHL